MYVFMSLVALLFGRFMDTNKYNIGQNGATYANINELLRRAIQA